MTAISVSRLDGMLKEHASGDFFPGSGELDTILRMARTLAQIIEMPSPAVDRHRPEEIVGDMDGEWVVSYDYGMHEPFSAATLEEATEKAYVARSAGATSQDDSTKHWPYRDISNIEEAARASERDTLVTVLEDVLITMRYCDRGVPLSASEEAKTCPCDTHASVNAGWAVVMAAREAT